MKEKEIDILIVKLFDHGLSAQEAKRLEEWLEEDHHLAYFNEFVELKYSLNKAERFDFHQSLKEIKKHIAQVQKRRRKRALFRYAAILAVLLGLGGVLFLINVVGQRGFIDEEKSVSVIVDNKIKVGEGKAILTLSDDTRVSLSEETSYKGENVRSEGEELQYDSSDQKQTELKYNTLTIPRGGQFVVRLADGTKVWLNSDSQMKYPVEFILGQPREVELVYGEAYFDVSSSEDHQGDHFVAIHDNMKAEVLGTEFNIKAYKDEKDVYTTLAEGSVELRNFDSKVILKPYDRAITKRGNEKVEMEVEQLSSLRELLWREGKFSFKHKSLKEIMKVLSRWYDMEVEFESKDKERIEFTGVLGKEQTIEQIMDIIQKTNNIHYEIRHKTLTIK